MYVFWKQTAQERRQQIRANLSVTSEPGKRAADPLPLTASNAILTHKTLK